MPDSARPTRQSRSRATLDRLLDATAALLAEKPFADASVAEIARRAGSSVGAFYGRFPDKESLLDCFDERFFGLARASCDELFDSDAWRSASLADSVARLCSLLVASHRRHQGVLRALLLRDRGRPDPSFQARAERHNEYVLGRVSAHLLSRTEPVQHPRPELAIRVAFLFTVAAIREAVLFGEGLAAAVSDHDLAAELTGAFLAYILTGQPQPGRRSPSKRGGRAAQPIPDASA